MGLFQKVRSICGFVWLRECVRAFRNQINADHQHQRLKADAGAGARWAMIVYALL
jgi:hypothetical protein